MPQPETEELLERLYLVETEGEGYPSDPAPESVTREAMADGLVERGEAKLRLTARGHAAGRDVVRRHRLAERLLCDVLAVAPDQFDDEACRFEHILQRGLDDKICILLGHPSTCPHGKPIPRGQCCRRASTDHIREVTPLSDGRPGAEGAVAYLATRDNREIQKLMAMGILPGLKIKLMQRFPSYVFQVGYSQFTVDHALAETIYVHWAPPPKHAESAPKKA